jgi:hypothetical protein
VVIEDGNLSYIAIYDKSSSSILKLSEYKELNPNWNYTEDEF